MQGGSASHGMHTRRNDRNGNCTPCLNVIHWASAAVRQHRLQPVRRDAAVRGGAPGQSCAPPAPAAARRVPAGHARRNKSSTEQDRRAAALPSPVLTTSPGMAPAPSLADRLRPQTAPSPQLSHHDSPPLHPLSTRPAQMPGRTRARSSEHSSESDSRDSQVTKRQAKRQRRTQRGRIRSRSRSPARQALPTPGTPRCEAHSGRQLSLLRVLSRSGP